MYLFQNERKAAVFLYKSAYAGALMQATSMEMTVMSYIPVTPSPMEEKMAEGVRLPVQSPTSTDRTVPVIRTTNTLTPARAATRTSMYGIT